MMSQHIISVQFKGCSIYLVLMGGGSSRRPASRICVQCDAENIGFQNRCVQCKARLDRRKYGLSQSKKSKIKEKKRRGVCSNSGNKHTYKTKKEAFSAIKAMFAKGRGLQPYWCKGCKGFHLTKLKL